MPLRPAEHQHQTALPLVRYIKSHKPIAASNTVVRLIDTIQNQIEAREMHLCFSRFNTFYVTAYIVYLFSHSVAQMQGFFFRPSFSREKNFGFMGLKELCPGVPQILNGKSNKTGVSKS